MRRRARECALQILYQLDVTGGLGEEPLDAPRLAASIAAYWQSFAPVSDEERVYAERLVEGVVARTTELDAAIGGASLNWRVSRMDKVDRNLLRLAAYELLHCPDVPRAAAINEAIEIAKRYGSGESAAFINGLLDQLGATRGER